MPAAATNTAALAGRLMLALIFVVEGWLKINQYEGTVKYMLAYGIPGALLPLVIVTELAGGILITVGLLTRFAAIALGGFCLLTAWFFHRDFSNPEQEINFYKNLAMAGGFLVLAAYGAGGWSIDAWRGRSWRARQQF